MIDGNDFDQIRAAFEEAKKTKGQPTAIIAKTIYIIHGTFFVCGLTRDDFTDLTPKPMKHYEEMYHDPQLFFLLDAAAITLYFCMQNITPLYLEVFYAFR